MNNHFKTAVFLLLTLSFQYSYAECISDSKRFSFHKENIIDNQTHLTWKRCSEGMTWNSKKCVGEINMMSLTVAKDAAKKAGKDWRVPTGEELSSLLSNPCTGKTTKTVLFSDIHDLGENSAPYWTSTQVEGIPNFYYYIDFLHVYVDAHSSGFSLAVRLVK